MQLTRQQLNFFETFGYLVVRQLLRPEEVAQVIEGFEWSIQNCGGGKEHDGSKRTMFGGPIEHRADMCALLDHPGVNGLIAGVTGEEFSYCSGDGNYYSGDTGWHPDGNWGQLWATKTAFYLDPVRRDTGCLRVIPGSHKPEHFIRQQGINPNESEELFGVPPREFPGHVALESDPGDVVIFNHDLYHASFGGSARRRMFTMNCTRQVAGPADQETARQYIKVHSPGGYDVNTGGGMFFPTMLETAGQGRRVHLRQAAAIHDELFPHLTPG
ncbi:MAG: hypothetical protein GKR89_26625 [Candidatus Latescibacteria bacterium]|nr:hypothetical protein [Candidatus Latescibacterota bacterium]